jgi:hypothetical protein
MGQSFVRVNRVIGEKKRVRLRQKPIVSFSARRDRNRCRIERLSRAPTRSRARDGAPGGGRFGSRRAGASAVYRRDTDLCGSAEDRVPCPARRKPPRARHFVWGDERLCR